MISSYLTSLFANCKVLTKTSEFNQDKLEFFLKTEVQKLITELGLEHEQNLIAFLIETNYKTLEDLLKRHPFIYIFYLVNSFNELKATQADELGRFPFEHSVQKTIGIQENTVLHLIKDSIKEHETLATAFKTESHKSYFFLSHDIDSLYGSTLQDGFWALKNKRFDVLYRIFVNVLLAKPHWFNIDLIMNLESEYDFKSTFYWLVNKGKIDERQTNSDYDIDSKKLVATLGEVERKGFENGLHKSVSPDSFQAELHKLSKKVIGNRYHYLKFNLPSGYKKIEESGLKLDASLGFAEHYGFRNSYGYPFSPYNIETHKAYSFLEVPLTLMDGTFQRYMKVPVQQTASTVISFLEKNKRDSLISILWHNTFFTQYKYKGYKEEYVKILRYLRDEKFVNINQSAIIEQFAWKKK